MEGGIKWDGGGEKFCFSPYEKGAGGGGGGRKSFQCYPPQPILNDQSLILLNFEDLVLLSPSEIRRELYKLMTCISQGIDRCKVPVVGKNGKLNETIERSALWSIKVKRPKSEKFKKCLSYIGPSSWNALPLDLHQAQERWHYKKLARNWVTPKALRLQAVSAIG